MESPGPRLSIYSRISHFSQNLNARTCKDDFALLFVISTCVIFAIVSIGIIAIGVTFKLYSSDVLNSRFYTMREAQIITWLTICTGVIIFLVAYIGCCGALGDSTNLLTAYASILLVMFLIHLGTVMLAFISVEDERYLAEAVEKSFTELHKHYNGSKRAEKIVDRLHHYYECCGKKGADDWGGKKDIPKSCYKGSKLYKIGCKTKFLNAISRYIKSIAYLTLLFAISELTGIIMTCYLSHSINKKRISNYR